MRITEGRITELIAGNVGRARQRVAKSGNELQTGLRVNRPSDDPAAWATAQRARFQSTVTRGRGDAMSVATESLSQTEGAMNSLQDVLARQRELAIAAANATYTADDRMVMAEEARALSAQAFAAVNATDFDGHYLLAGSHGDAPAFDAAGVYQGDGDEASVPASASATLRGSLSGELLTSAHGVDILASLEAFAVALETNDVTGIETAVGEIETAVEQVSRARSRAGGMLSSLEQAQHAREDLELHLSTTIARELEVDSIAAASELAQATQALEVAQAVTNSVMGVLAPT